MQLASGSRIRPAAAASPLSAAFTAGQEGPRRYSLLFAHSDRRDIVTLLSDKPVSAPGLLLSSKLPEMPGASGIAARSCASIGLGYAANSTCGGHTTSRRKTTLVVAYRGNSSYPNDRTGPASPPRAGPCARAPLSPPAAPASFSTGRRLSSGT